MGNNRKEQWLDTETQACLQRSPPSKLAPPTTETFSLVVLNFDQITDHRRQVRALERVLQTSFIDAEWQTTRTPPFILKRQLTLSDAVLGQFELICSDIISVFITDAVLSAAEPEYLAALYEGLLRSDEFASVTVWVNALPQPADSAGSFLRQFIGEELPSLPYPMQVTRKKSRIMSHWARKFGVVVSVRD